MCAILSDLGIFVCLDASAFEIKPGHCVIFSTQRNFLELKLIKLA